MCAHACERFKQRIVLVNYQKIDSLNHYVCVSCSVVLNSQSHDHHTHLSMKFPEQYWSGSPFSSLGDLPYPGIKPVSPTLQADSLPSQPPAKPFKITIVKEEMYSFQLNNLVSNFASATLGKLNNLLELQFLCL